MIVKKTLQMALVLIGVWTNSFFVSSQMLIDYPLLEQSRFSRIRYFINNDCHCGSVHIGKQKVPFLHYFQISAHGGLSGLTYQSDFGKMNPKANGALGIAYMFYIHGIAGLKLGANVAYSGSQFKAINYHDKYRVVDVEEDKMDVYYTADEITERHHQLLLEIPFQLALRFDPITIDLGPKFSIPLLKKYREQLYGVDLCAYYPAYDVEVDKALALAAGKYLKSGIDGTIDKFPALWISLSTNVAYTIPLKSGNELGVGVYADYALKGYLSQRTRNLSLVTITDTHDGIPVERLVESVLRANHALSGKQVVPKYSYFCTGLKLTYNIVLKTKK
ncbi:MAG: hypothetical protein QM280_02700 [Bacteroidota bacterium]|jgi:hypothetical protein|nr:hypothetical protein [Bacteroidota bacterium]HHT60918.1 hypothetical protein [Bacteroidales bacterium]HOA47205.1 hypothetical protein [Paludibacteraceae bacterium]HOH70849.1 hypothetical protein [Paludibacteraceae bacterium]HOO24613.1 hypothetical protein [Paludibacteraceae bacterium]